MPAAARPDYRWDTHRLLGRHLLRLGRTEEAITHYRAAYDVLQEAPAEMPRQNILDTVTELAVSYLRLGETATVGSIRTQPRPSIQISVQAWASDWRTIK